MTIENKLMKMQPTKKNALKPTLQEIYIFM